MSRAARQLPYARQSIDEADVAAVTAVLRGDWLTTGPAVEAFEQAFAARVGAPRAVACSSGTAALHLACLAAGIGPDDAVIVPAITFLGTANAVRLAGGEVIFADVDAGDGLMRVEHVERQLRDTARRIKAIIPVHLNGLVADAPALRALAQAHGATVIEDACHALGTRYAAGSAEAAAVGECRHSDLATFSFHPTKTLTMGEGGVVTTGDDALADAMVRLRNHGMVRDPALLEHPGTARDAAGMPCSWIYEMQQLGLNYRASDIHCALGRSQLDKLEAFGRQRQRLMRHYDQRLADLVPRVRPVPRPDGNDPVLHLYAVLIDFDAIGRSRAALMAQLRERGIGTQVHYRPLTEQPYYHDRYGTRPLAGSQAYYTRVLSLPFFPAMDTDDVDYVVDTLTGITG